MRFCPKPTPSVRLGRRQAAPTSFTKRAHNSRMESRSGNRRGRRRQCHRNIDPIRFFGLTERFKKTLSTGRPQRKHHPPRTAGFKLPPPRHFRPTWKNGRDLNRGRLSKKTDPQGGLSSMEPSANWPRGLVLQDGSRKRDLMEMGNMEPRKGLCVRFGSIWPGDVLVRYQGFLFHWGGDPVSPRYRSLFRCDAAAIPGQNRITLIFAPGVVPRHSSQEFPDHQDIFRQDSRRRAFSSRTFDRPAKGAGKVFQDPC